eukprot:Em0001g3489a
MELKKTRCVELLKRMGHVELKLMKTRHVELKLMKAGHLKRCVHEVFQWRTLWPEGWLMWSIKEFTMVTLIFPSDTLTPDQLPGTQPRTVEEHANLGHGKPKNVPGGVFIFGTVHNLTHLTTVLKIRHKDWLVILFSMQCWGHRFLSRTITGEIQNCVLYWNAIAGYDCLMEPFQDLYCISSVQLHIV